MAEITFVFDPSGGALVVEDNQYLSAEAVEQLEKHLGAGQAIGCPRLLEIIKTPAVSSEESAQSFCVRIAGYYHDSLTEGRD